MISLAKYRQLLASPGLWTLLGYGYWAVERLEDGAYLGQKYIDYDGWDYYCDSPQGNFCSLGKGWVWLTGFTDAGNPFDGVPDDGEPRQATPPLHQVGPRRTRSNGCHRRAQRSSRTASSDAAPSK